jgi:uncharacterized alpha-E superfamily protein
MNTLTHDETAEILKALHQWLTSQGVGREHWGLLLAKAAGHEVYRHRIGRDEEVGLAILGLAMRLNAMEDRIYAKD